MNIEELIQEGVGVEEVDAVKALIKPVNRYLYENSPQSGSKVEQDYLNSPDRLYNDKLPTIACDREQPQHRMMCMMKARGMSNREIAQSMGKSDAWVSQVLRAPWARQRIIEIQREIGMPAIAALFEGEVKDCIETMIEIRDNAKAALSTRLAASNSLLDRALGKPTQHIEQKVTEVADPEAEIQQLRRELVHATGRDPLAERN